MATFQIIWERSNRSNPDVVNSVQPNVLIIGAGPAGLAAAGYLAEKGITPLLVEQGLFAGGHAGSLPCQAVQACAKCGACLLEEAATRARLAGVSLKCRSILVSATKNGAVYQVTISSGPDYIDANRCSNCDQCYQICPVAGQALIKSPVRFGPQYGLQIEKCPPGCRACQEACPDKAIDLAAQARREELTVQAILLTAGFTPFDARLKPRLGYGRLPDVLTAMNLDHLLRDHQPLVRPSTGLPPANLAFIQCVGSRDVSIGRDYCSRVCCGYAMRLAKLVRHRWPAIKVTIFYMDLQNAGRNFDQFYREVKGQVTLIPAIPGEINLDDQGRLMVPYMDGATGLRHDSRFDLVVLSVGLGPPVLSGLDSFNLTKDTDGFPESRVDAGLWVAGAAAGPRGVAEAIASAERAAAEIAAMVKRS